MPGWILMVLIGCITTLLGFVVCLGLKLASVGIFAWWYFASLPATS